MNRIFHIFLLAISTSFFIGCEVANHTPIITIQNQTEKLHAIIEKTSAEKYAGQNYQSLSFGALKVFKPEAFVQLDSMYRIKKEYLDNNDLRGLHRSEIEELIPGYRVAAQEQIQDVQYEIEHLFQTSNKDSLRVYHSFFLFNYQDSLISITPFYNFKISKEHQKLYYAYQFDFHFVTDRDLYISKAELEFIHFFKQKEVELIGNEELQPFMEHTMRIMEKAKSVQTIDFRAISKQMAIDEFKKMNKEIVIEKIGSLFALEENELVQAYELDIEWQDELTKHKITTFSFSPYLEITNVKTQFK